MRVRACSVTPSHASHSLSPSPPADFSAGTREDWRDDADDFPAAALGEALGDWEGEVWVDVNNEVSTVVLRRVGVWPLLSELGQHTCTRSSGARRRRSQL